MGSTFWGMCSTPSERSSRLSPSFKGEYPQGVGVLVGTVPTECGVLREKYTLSNANCIVPTSRDFRPPTTGEMKGVAATKERRG